MFFSLLLFLWSTGQAQTILKAYLFDKTRRQPIPFATIKVLHKPSYTFSDSIGNFKVEASTSDTILITSIGFVTLKTTGFPIDTIYLDPISKELSPVILVQKKLASTSILGIASKADFRWGLIPGDEFAQKIYLSLNTKEYCKIKKVIISMERISNETPLLLHIYSVDTYKEQFFFTE